MASSTEDPFGRLGSAVPAVSPPSFLRPPQPAHWQGGVNNQSGLDAV